MKKKVLVTGGTGYIGSHTVVELQRLGFDVLIIDNLSNSKIEVLKKIEKISGIKPLFEKVEMCDETQMKSFFSKHPNIDAVIHFAAVLQVDESVRLPLKYYRNNLQSTINLIDCMMENNISNIVFSSSCTVYGNPDTLPVNEFAPVKIVSEHGRSIVSSDSIFDLF